VVVVAALVLVIQHRRQREQLQYRLLATMPDATAADPSLVAFATQEAKPLYAQHCAVCHGPDLRGRTDLGAPNLADGIWLYGSGRVYDIERTLLYGIRSGNSKSHNITDMPGFGVSGKLSAGEVRSIVQYLLRLSGRPYQAEAANEGQALYVSDKGDCGDCHGATARGDADYGSSDLTANVWNSGDSADDLYKVIYYGEHRVMPAWIGTISLEQIRALSLYIATVSHSAPSSYEPQMSRASQ
jgi:cytochrome c oxidase cbb3-type subunit 3